MLPVMGAWSRVILLPATSPAFRRADSTLRRVVLPLPLGPRMQVAVPGNALWNNMMDHR